MKIAKIKIEFGFNGDGIYIKHEYDNLCCPDSGHGGASYRELSADIMEFSAPNQNGTNIDKCINHFIQEVVAEMSDDAMMSMYYAKKEEKRNDKNDR